ncbi:MAG TPA: ribose-5-phosphate isomerase RpiA [Candidatus Dormibacteraeota bacterium]
MADQDPLKAAAARAALELVADGMLLGLGTGSTAAIFIDLLGERLRSGLQVTAIATSRRSREQAAALGIPVVDDLPGPIDLAVDGADEIDPDRNLLKGRGGALVREKLVAVAARRFVVIADESKLVPRLGVGVLPVEVLPFLWRETARRLEAVAPLTWTLRGGVEAPFVSDNGNLVLDLTLPGGVADPVALGAQLKGVTGVVEHGIFAGLATACLVAGGGGVEVMGSPEGAR